MMKKKNESGHENIYVTLEYRAVVSDLQATLTSNSLFGGVRSLQFADGTRSS